MISDVKVTPLKILVLYPEKSPKLNWRVFEALPAEPTTQNWVAKLVHTSITTNTLRGIVKNINVLKPCAILHRDCHSNIKAVFIQILKTLTIYAVNEDWLHFAQVIYRPFLIELPRLIKQKIKSVYIERSNLIRTRCNVYLTYCGWYMLVRIIIIS